MKHKRHVCSYCQSKGHNKTTCPLAYTISTHKDQRNKYKHPYVKTCMCTACQKQALRYDQHPTHKLRYTKIVPKERQDDWERRTIASSPYLDKKRGRPVEKVIILKNGSMRTLTGKPVSHAQISPKAKFFHEASTSYRVGNRL